MQTDAASGRACHVQVDGGVTPENLATWIQAGCAGAGLGSDLYRAGQAVERTREQAERFISASKS